MSGFGQCKAYLLFHTFNYLYPTKIRRSTLKSPFGCCLQNTDQWAFYWLRNPPNLYQELSLQPPDLMMNVSQNRALKNQVGFLLYPPETQNCSQWLEKSPCPKLVKHPVSSAVMRAWKSVTTPCISKGFAQAYMSKEPLPQLQREAGEVKIIPGSHRNSPDHVHCAPSEGGCEPSWKAKRVDKLKLSVGCTRTPEHVWTWWW